MGNRIHKREKKNDANENSNSKYNETDNDHKKEKNIYNETDSYIFFPDLEQ